MNEFYNVLIKYLFTYIAIECSIVEVVYGLETTSVDCKLFLRLRIKKQ